MLMLPFWIGRYLEILGVESVGEGVGEGQIIGDNAIARTIHRSHFLWKLSLLAGDKSLETGNPIK